MEMDDDEQDFQLLCQQLEADAEPWSGMDEEGMQEQMEDHPRWAGDVTRLLHERPALLYLVVDACVLRARAKMEPLTKMDNVIYLPR